MRSTLHRPVRTSLQSFVLLAAALVTSACALPGQDPGPGLRGYGTPSVSTYVSPDQASSVQAQLVRCANVPRQLGQTSGTQGLTAACDQLRHTLHNQPGNAVEASAL